MLPIGGAGKSEREAPLTGRSLWAAILHGGAVFLDPAQAPSSPKVLKSLVSSVSYLTYSCEVIQMKTFFLRTKYFCLPFSFKDQRPVAKCELSVSECE